MTFDSKPVKENGFV